MWFDGLSNSLTLIPLGLIDNRASRLWKELPRRFVVSSCHPLYIKHKNTTTTSCWKSTAAYGREIKCRMKSCNASGRQTGTWTLDQICSGKRVPFQIPRSCSWSRKGSSFAIGSLFFDEIQLSMSQTRTSSLAFCLGVGERVVLLPGRRIRFPMNVIALEPFVEALKGRCHVTTLGAEKDRRGLELLTELGLGLSNAQSSGTRFDILWPSRWCLSLLKFCITITFAHVLIL